MCDFATERNHVYFLKFNFKSTSDVDLKLNFEKIHEKKIKFKKVPIKLANVIQCIDGR